MKKNSHLPNDLSSNIGRQETCQGRNRVSNSHHRSRERRSDVEVIHDETWKSKNIERSLEKNLKNDFSTGAFDL